LGALADVRFTPNSDRLLPPLDRGDSGKMPRSGMEAHMQSLDGTMWRLIEASAFDDNGHELSPPLGKHPMGFGMFEAGRIVVAVVDGGLSLPANAPSRTFIAYSGKYRFDGAEFVTDVDSASSPNLAGQQIRHIRFESPTRMVITPKNNILGRDAGLKFVWERVG
jgi:hypothetical protein